MMSGSSVCAVVLCGSLALSSSAGGGQRAAAPTQPPRDTPFLAETEPEPTDGSLTGRVVAADTGSALTRATVRLRGLDTRERRSVDTDESGRYAFTGLPAGRYTVTVSRAGFTTIALGQDHPRQPPLPVQLDEGETIEGVDIALPRGSVITGHIADDAGEPLPRAMVQAQRFSYQQGQRELVPAGNDMTDDRGQFRIFDLAPGEYIVSVTLPRMQGGFGMRGFGGRGGFAGRGGRGGFGVGSGAPPTGDETTGLAPSYYPGVTRLLDATALAVGLSEELSGVNFAAQRVSMARVGGLVLGPDGTPASGTQILLTSPESATPGQMRRGRVGRNGDFLITDVPPGDYTVQAVSRRGRGNREPVFANERLSVNGQDMTDLVLRLRRGAVLNGRVTMGGTGLTRLDELPRLSIETTSVAPQPMGQGDGIDGDVGPDGRFSLRGVGGGARLIRVDRLPDHLRLEAVHLGGRDVTDTPLSFNGEVDGVTVILTDQLTELTGQVRDGRGRPLTGFTVIAFPADESLWQPQSRHVRASRPDQNGQYQLRGLPAGDYLLSVLDVVEQGEWFDPRLLTELRDDAARVNLRAGQPRTLDLTLGDAQP